MARKHMLIMKKQKFIQEAGIGEVFNINNKILAFYSLTDGDVVEMALIHSDCNNSDKEDDIDNTTEDISIDDMMKICNGLGERPEQCAFTTEQEIMSVYKVKVRLP
jgi:hypothetical protein